MTVAKKMANESPSAFEESEEVASPKIDTIRFNIDAEPRVRSDKVVIEEPLEIIVNFQSQTSRDSRSLAITMRTPGQDFFLVLGFLYCEGLITQAEQIALIQHWGPKVGRLKLNNTVKVVLDNTANISNERFNRYFTMNSSCGICGKASLEALAVDSPFPMTEPSWRIAADTLYRLNDNVRKEQKQFEQTGAIHAAVLLDNKGKVIKLMEDVGRHNAMDKLVGYALSENLLPLHNGIIYFSGRLSYELVQKAVMAGVNCIISVGAPTNLAIEIAKEYGLTVVGFLKSNRFNIYAGESRVH